MPHFQSVDNQNYFTGNHGVNAGVVDTDGISDGEYYNIFNKPESTLGWYADNLTTNLQTCGGFYFKNKEDEYFGYPTGEATNLSNLDTKEFTVQGLGMADIAHNDSGQGNLATLTFINNTSSSMFSDGGSSMATGNGRWVISSATHLGEVGENLASGQTVAMTISPFSNGVYTGFPLSASNFELEDAAETPDLTFTVDADTNITPAYSGSDTCPVIKVVFTDSSYGAGDPQNTVTMTVHLNSTYTVTADTTVTLDIDETAQITAPRTRDVCLLTQYDFELTSVVAAPVVTTVSNVANSVVDPGSITTSDPTINKHTGVVDEGDDSLVAKITFTRAGTSYFVSGGNNNPYVSFESMSPVYEQHYSYVIDEVFTGLLLTSFVVKIYYNAPEEGSWFEEDDICLLGHKAIVHYNTATPDEGDVNDLVSADVPSVAPSSGDETVIIVHGTPDTPYEASFQKKDALDSTTTATSGGYYNFETNSFQDASSGYTSTIGPSGVNTHSVSLPSVTDDTRYDFVINPNVGGSFSSVSSTVPTAAGEAILTQYGVRTLTIKPSGGTAADFGTATEQTIVRPYIYSDELPSIPSPATVVSAGKTDLPDLDISNGIASTRLVLEKEDLNLTSGMYVMMPYSDSLIPHETTIASISDNALTLSAAVSVPSASELHFVKKQASIVPFSITIPPAAGRTFTKVNFPDTQAAIGGLSAITATVESRQQGAVSIVVDSTQGVIAGMAVTGIGIVGRPDTPGINVVKGVTNATTVVVVYSEPDLAAGTVLTFSGSVSGVSGVSGGGANEAIRPLHAQVSIVNGNAVVQGYLNVEAVTSTSDMQIYINDLININ